MRLLAILIAALVLAFAALPAGASLLSDLFGVSLSVGGGGIFNHDWTPVSSTADYFVDDNWSSYFGRPPYGGEAFDIEAMYFDNDDQYAYVAVVTSVPVPMGVPFMGTVVHPGDLFLDLGGGILDYGIDIDDATGVVADTDPGDWYQSNGMYIAEVGPTNFAGGLPMGYAAVDYYNYGLVERGIDTYVFEVTVDRADAHWHGHVGVVTSLLRSADFTPGNTTAFVCGPEIMMRYAALALSDAEVAAGDIWVSMERNMQCGIGLCGHCQMGKVFVCKDGPVFDWATMKPLMAVKEL